MRRAVVVVLVAVACREPTSRTVDAPVYFDVERAVPQPAPARVAFAREDAPPSLLVTAAHRRRGATTAAGVAALWHVERAAVRWGLDAAALDAVEVAHVHDTGRGAIVVKLRQRIAGLEVARTALAVVMDRDLRLVALSGALRPARAGREGGALGARDAIERALADVGTTAQLAALPDRGGYQRFTAHELAGPARARRVWFPVGDQLVAAWTSEVAVRRGARIAGYRHVHAAADGRLLLRSSLTDDATFSYRVWADATGDLRYQDGPQGDYTPHPTGAPDGFDPAFVAPALVAIDGFNVHHDPWLPAGALATAGNNVDAYADLDFDDGFSAGDLRPAVTSPGVFDHAYDVALDPGANQVQQMAAVTQMFYVTNWLHDDWYDSGFTEGAGNGQVSNLGRGGAEGDPLLAEGQDASGIDNANMFTPADGASPRMQMFLFDAPPVGPRRDGTIDSHIIAHEWGHYLHHRLVDCGSNECASMSEGWGDFNALFASVRPGDDLGGTWGLGAYAARTFTANAAYWGIRRYPYSTNLAKSPLTLRFVESGVPLPQGPPSSDVDFLQGADNWEVHDSGEIWCAMLWEGLVDLLRSPRFTFAGARRRYADYVVAGMIAAPVEPSYTEQRDAILAAAAATDPADFVLLANAFARRGFGTGAIAPPVNSFDGSGVVESFAVTGALQIASVTVEEAAVSCDGDGILDVGETGRVAVTVRNLGAATLAGPTVTLAGPAGVVFPAGASATLPAIAPFQTATATLAIRLDETPTTLQTIPLQVGAADASAAIGSVAQAVAVDANLDVTPAASAVDGFEEATLVWTATAGGFARVRDPDSSNVLRVAVARTGDHVVQTPALQVAAGQNLSVGFRHRHAFAAGPGTLLDGGVVEVSTNGIDFADAAIVASVPYTGAITGTGNVLAGRQAFGGTNPSNPAFDDVVIDFGTTFSGQTIVLRFRAGGDDLPDDSHWEIDDFVTVGLANTPFPLVGAETGSCLPGARPIADAGPDVAVPSAGAGALDGSASTDPDGGALAFEWNQLSGPIVALSDKTVAQPAFTAPATATTRSARFQLVVRDPDGRVSAPSDVLVSIIGSGTIDGPPDAAVDGPPDAPADGPPDDAGLGPDAGNALDGGGAGGCCDAGGDARGAWLLGLGVLAVLRRRRSLATRRGT